MIKRFGLIAVMLVLTAVMILDFKINEPFLRFFESMVEVDLSARSEMQTQTIEIEEGERLFIEVDESRLNLEPTKKKSLTVTAQSEDAVSVVRSEDGTVLKVLEGSVATVSLPEAILPQVTAYGASVYVSVNVAEIDARSSYLSLTDVKTGKIKAADSYVQLTNSTPEIIETTRCQLEIAQAEAKKDQIILDATETVVNVSSVALVKGNAQNSTVSLEYVDEVALTVTGGTLRVRRTENNLGLHLEGTNAYLELGDHFSRITAEESEVTIKMLRTDAELLVETTGTEISTNVVGAEGPNFSYVRGKDAKEQTLKTQGGILRLYSPFVSM